MAVRNRGQETYVQYERCEHAVHLNSNKAMFSVLLASFSNTPEHSVSRMKNSNEH